MNKCKIIECEEKKTVDFNWYSTIDFLQFYDRKFYIHVDQFFYAEILVYYTKCQVNIFFIHVNLNPRYLMTSTSLLSQLKV